MACHPNTQTPKIPPTQPASGATGHPTTPIRHIFQVVKRISGTFGWLCHERKRASQWVWQVWALFAYGSYRTSRIRSGCRSQLKFLSPSVPIEQSCYILSPSFSLDTLHYLRLTSNSRGAQTELATCALSNAIV